MAPLTDEFQKRRQLLVSVRYSEAKPRLTGLLQWMESHSPLKAILDTVRAKVDVKKLVEGCDYNHPPRASTPEEIAAVGILLMEQCQAGQELFQLAFGLGITPPYSSNALQDFVDEAMQRFIDPALDYVSDQIEARDDHPDADAVIEGRIGMFLHASLDHKLPFTADRLRKIAEQCSAATTGADWFNIGNSCREAFKTFLAELLRQNKITAPADVKDADIKNLIKCATIQHSGGGRFDETLIKLVAAAWDHGQTVIHRAATTQDEAVRLYVWTALAIGEVALAVEERTLAGN